MKQKTLSSSHFVERDGERTKKSICFSKLVFYFKFSFLRSIITRYYNMFHNFLYFVLSRTCTHTSVHSICNQSLLFLKQCLSNSFNPDFHATVHAHITRDPLSCNFILHQYDPRARPDTWKVYNSNNTFPCY